MSKISFSKSRADEDFGWEVRDKRSRLIPYIKDAKRRRQSLFSKKVKLLIIGRTCDLDWLLKKMQWNQENSRVDTPAEQRLDCLEDTGQQNSESGRYCYSEKRTQRRGSSRQDFVTKWAVAEGRSGTELYVTSRQGQKRHTSRKNVVNVETT